MELYIVVPYKGKGMGSRFLLVLYPVTGPISQRMKTKDVKEKKSC